MLGFDSEYRNCASDPELVRVSASEQRILLTRDRELLKHSAVTRGYWVRQTDSHHQLAEVVQRFDLNRSFRPFTRCMACNTLLRPAAKAEIRHLIAGRTAELYDDFLQCPGCGRVYWKGSHWRRMQQWIQELVS